MADDGMKARETRMMKRHTPVRLKYVLKLALPGCLAFSLIASLLMSMTASCMACPTCTLALAKRSETTDNTPLALLALLGAGGGGTTNKRIWVTDNGLTGNLGGIGGADGMCSNASDANWPGSGTYMAMIVDGTSRRACTSTNCSVGQNSEHVSWVLQPNTTYVRSDGITVIFTADANGVWDFANPWTNSVANNVFPNPQAWTGLKTDWTTDSNTCNQWMDGNPTPYYGAQGLGNDTIPAANQGPIYAYFNPCNQSPNHVYCVEQ